jgi:lipopolysaccharide/colanic/teichoic acid biosynthesis glycosyltransferase
MYYQVTKRLLDIIGALLGLLFTAIVYIPLAVAIKLDSPGPIVFAQERLGRNLLHFKFYKFRTMYWNAPASGEKPSPNDERVTRVGRFLRRTSIDELPQCFNILRGEMSLVGPRPEQLTFLAHYELWQQQRFEVKPGLTGWWQINGRKQPMHAHIEEDIYYVEHRCLLLDLVILWRTVNAVLSGRGAV